MLVILTKERILIESSEEISSSSLPQKQTDRCKGNTEGVLSMFNLGIISSRIQEQQVETEFPFFVFSSK